MNEVLTTKYKNTFEYHKSKKPTSKVLVCVAGVSEGAFRWYESLPILTTEFNVVLFNNPSVGGEPSAITFTVDELAEKYQHILDLLEIDSYYLLGHSMGGFISQRMYLNNPTKINKLVLIGTSFGSIQFDIDIKKLMDTKNTFKSSIKNFKDDRRIIRMEDFTFTKDFQAKNPELIKRYLQEKMVTYKLAKKDLVSHFVCGGGFSSLGETHKIIAPTLVIHGTEDRMVDVSGGKLLAKTIPNARFLEKIGSGHTPFIEDVSMMNDVVEFLINDKQVGKILEKDYIITPEILERDKYFREHSKSIGYKNFLKELFMLEELGDKLEEYMISFKKFMGK